MSSLLDEKQPRDRDEPVALTALKAGPMEEYIAVTDRKVRENPDGFYPLGICRHCGTSLGSAPEDKVIPVGVFGYLPNVCCAACSDKAKEMWEAEQRAAAELQFAGLIPTAFLRWDDSLGNTTAKARAFTRFGFDTKKGLVLHGTSGTCKTFILWQLVRLIVEENAKHQPEEHKTWLVLDAFEIATKGIPAEAERVHFLFIDDLGNEPTTTKFETALLHLIRKRCDWHRPTTVTTQLTGKQFKEKFFSGAAAEAIMRRFHDATIPIDTDNRSVAGMGSATPSPSATSKAAA